MHEAGLARAFSTMRTLDLDLAEVRLLDERIEIEPV